jgi:hypothetical protein
MKTGRIIHIIEPAFDKLMGNKDWASRKRFSRRNVAVGASANPITP